MRKLLTVIALGLISVMSFAVEVQLWEKWQTSLDPAYDAVIAAFEKANPTIKIVAVSISIAMARVLRRYFLKRSSYSQTLLLVVRTVPVQ